MAATIKGIHFKIGAETTELKTALREAETAASKTTKELRAIDKALKFDPSNLTLLAQKQELLGKQVANTKEKLETLKQAEAQVQQQFAKGKISEEQYRAFQREIEVTKNVLNGYENKLSSVNKTVEQGGSAYSKNQQAINALQAEQAQLASEAEKVASSFKRQESELGSSASEMDKLAIAEQKVASQSSILERQISNLERQLELTKSEYGENSTQANKMEAELNQAKTTLNKLNNELKETKGASDSAQLGMEAMSATVRAEALQMVGEKMGELSQKLFELGGDAMQAAASMKASNAQFETVFSGMETQARSSLEAISKDLDIVPERLQGTFTQMAGFAKTTGMETADALNLTERATRAAADGAAFYDKSIEEVSENLQSFLKGNYENDAALGISATETTRNAAANKLYGKSFNELSESQKQLTLLQMVEDGNKLSGALGQAARESDGFENVLGNLKQTGQNALAAIGTPILEAMIPIFQSVAKVVQELANWFSQLATPIKQFIVLFLGVMAAVGVVLPIFLTLQVAAAAVGTTIGGLIASILPIVGIIAAVVAAIALFVVALTHLWNNNEQFREKVLEIWEVIKEFINSIITEISNFVKDIWGTLTSWWTENQEIIKQATTTVWSAIKSVISVVLKAISPIVNAAMKNIQTLVKAAWKIVKNSIQTTLKAVFGIVKAIMQAINGDWKGAWKTIQQVVKDVWNAIKSNINTALTALIQVFTRSWNTIKSVIGNVLNAIMSVISNVWNSIESFLSSVGQSIASTASSIWNSILSSLSNIWNSLSNAVQTTFQAIADFLNNIWTTISTTATNTWNTLVTTLTFIWNTIYNSAMSVFNSVMTFFSNTWTSIQNTASSVWNAITSFLGGLWNGILSTASSIFNTLMSTLNNIWNSIKETATNVWNNIKSTVVGIWNSLKDTASTVWNNIKTTISNAINAAKDAVGTAIDKMKSFFNFSWSLPPIKMPRITISGKFSLDPPSAPSFGISWFKKGGILTKPTAFGMNGNNMMVGGEAGKEAVLPLNERTLGMIGDRIMATVSENIVVNVPEQSQQPVILNIDGKTFAQLIVSHISQAQADRMMIVENGGSL